MQTVSRRGFLALGGTGAAGALLAACGEETDPRETGDDDDLTAAEAEAEQRLAAAYGLAASTQEGSERAALETQGHVAEGSIDLFGREREVRVRVTSGDHWIAGSVLKTFEPPAKFRL